MRYDRKNRFPSDDLYTVIEVLYMCTDPPALSGAHGKIDCEMIKEIE